MDSGALSESLMRPASTVSDIILCSAVPQRQKNAENAAVMERNRKINAVQEAYNKDVAENEICFKTAEEFKGLESDVVIYLTHEFTDIPSSTIDKRKEYVAITRARYYLYILNTKCKAILGE